MTRNQVRIISGQWRGRKLSFPAMGELRPTGDRLRETLFNWLMPYLSGAHVLDAFAGSGALGFEALSRGAAEAVMVEESTLAIKKLRENQRFLQAKATILEKNAIDYLQTTNRFFDIIFLDPPFASGLVESCLLLIRERRLLKQNGLIYIETGRQSKLNLSGWSLHREVTQGQVHAFLLRI